MYTILSKYREDMQLRGFSQHTVRTYTDCLTDYLSRLDKPLNETTEYDIRKYQLYLQNDRNLSAASVNVYLSAVRYLYEVTMCRHMNWKIAPMMKKPRKLPDMLTHDEIQQILDHTLNLKHKAMFMLAYNAGLRISEIAHLKTTDIDSTGMRILIRGGKGNKDRYTILSDICLETLRQYWLMYRPKHPEKFLFLGMRKITCVTESTIAAAFDKAVKSIGITKDVSMHTLRHCFATDLLNQGASLMEIKELLGHASLQSTTIYLHLANITDHMTSPLDILYGDEYV